MTDEQMNAAIAEACPNAFLLGHNGIWNYANHTVGELMWHPCKGNSICNDLNAMHEAERTIAPVRVPRYISEVWAAMCKGGNVPEMDIGTIHATASQRAEAFLHTIGKWVAQ
jgi:hypothetical protein